MNETGSDYKESKVCIPTYNEEESIEEVLENVQESGYEPVVIDGGSTDKTVSIVKDKEVELMEQQYEGGKGAAVVEALEKIDTDILVLIDGDCTYEPRDIDKLIEPIRQDEYDHVLANRFHNMDKEAMSTLHIFGNRVVNLVFSLLFGENLVDILTGFRALRVDSFDTSKIESRGFDIETELCGYSVKNNHKIKVIGTSYYERKGESKLGEIKDSLKIGSRMLTTRLKRE